MPLYDLVKQDYIPTNVDESEFEVSVKAREGASLVVDGRGPDRASRTSSATMPGVELMLATVGTRGFGGVNRGEMYVRLHDIDDRGRSRSAGWWRGLLARRSRRGLARQFHAARQDGRGPPAG